MLLRKFTAISTVVFCSILLLLCFHDELKGEDYFAMASERDTILRVEEKVEFPKCTGCSIPSEYEEYEDRLRVPSIVHFVWITVPSRPFQLADFLAVKAARVNIRPRCICIHVVNGTEPGGEWWNRARLYAEVLSARDPVDIFGKPVNVPAHKSDIIRMEVLMKYGGIYLDTDVIALRSFEPLMDHSFLVARGTMQKGDIGTAVILARRNSSFIHRWYTEYKNFDDSDWGHHALKVPYRLMKITKEQDYAHLRDWSSSLHTNSSLAGVFGEDFTILNILYFYFPSYVQLDMIFKQDVSSQLRESYAIHLWSNVAHKKGFIMRATMDDIHKRDCTFNLIARKVLADETDGLQRLPGAMF
mmetsp:Transcript_7607/g.12119  ORF Transcript_7607/g.12119 Transcript_7607/m.12119 type:complete len:358 (-) Transcript_7607:242-1315(-)